MTSDSSTSTDYTYEYDESDEIIPPSPIQFWTFLFFEIPSLACSIFLLFHLLFNRQLRNALHNHVIIILLSLAVIIEIFDNPLYIDAYRLGGNTNSFPMTASVCLMWWYVDFGVYGAVTVFLAWGSIERHILVFHSHQLLRTKRQRFFIHYIPLIIVGIYIFGFYIGAILLPPCRNTFDFTSLGCGLSPCYESIDFLNTWDYLGNGIICSFIETTSSIILIIRVLWQKRCARQRLSWRKYRRMAFQLLSVSCLSLTIVFPQSLIVVIEQLGGSNLSNFGSQALPYLNYLYTFFVFLLPFICLGCLPELWSKLLFCKPKRRQTVGAITPAGAQCQPIPVASPSRLT